MSHEPPEENSGKSEFEAANDQRPLSLAEEFLYFVVEHKKWWLVPLLLALGAMGLLIVLGSTGAAPFIYTFF